MKTRQARYGYIFAVYFPVLILGIVLAALIPQIIANTVNGLNIIATILVVIACFRSHEKKTLIDDQTLKSTSITKLLILQLITIFVGYGIYNSYFTFPSLLAGKPIQLQNFPWYMILFPWPLILLTSLALRDRKNSSPQNSIRFTTQPIFKSSSEKIFGIGIEIFVKQGLEIACAYTLTLGLMQIFLILFQYLKLPIVTGLHTPIILFGMPFLFLLHSRFWNKLIHYFWIKKLSLVYLLMSLCVIVSLFFLVQAYATKFIALFNSANIDPLGNNAIFKAEVRYAPLSYYALWLLWMPLIAFYLSRINLELSTRQYIISGLIAPICLSILDLVVTKLQFFEKISISTGHLEILLLLLSLLLVIIPIYGFQDPAYIGLIQTRNLNKTQKTVSSHQFMSQLSNFIIMCAILILVIGPRNIAIFAASIALPNLITISVISIIALYHIFVEK